MSKFILEYKDNEYSMYYLNDYSSISTGPCEDMKEALYKMVSLLKDMVKSSIEGVMDSMKELKELCQSGRLAIDFFGIDLMGADELRTDMTGVLEKIADEYLQVKCGY